MKVSVLYFAILREQRGEASEALATEARTPGELYEELSQIHRFSLPVSTIKAAVNKEFASMDQPLKEGDEVVFLPPVAGG